MAKRSILVPFLALFLLAIPAQARPIGAVTLTNTTGNGAWITLYNDGIIKSILNSGCLHGNATETLPTDAARVRVRAEILAGNICKGNKLDDIDYKTDVYNDKLRLIRYGNGFRIVRI